VEERSQQRRRREIVSIYRERERESELCSCVVLVLRIKVWWWCCCCCLLWSAVPGLLETSGRRILLQEFRAVVSSSFSIATTSMAQTRVRRTISFVRINLCMRETEVKKKEVWVSKVRGRIERRKGTDESALLLGFKGQCDLGDTNLTSHDLWRDKWWTSLKGRFVFGRNKTLSGVVVLLLLLGRMDGRVCCIVRPFTRWFMMVEGAHTHKRFLSKIKFRD